MPNEELFGCADNIYWWRSSNERWSATRPWRAAPRNRAYAGWGCHADCKRGNRRASPGSFSSSADSVTGLIFSVWRAVRPSSSLGDRFGLSGSDRRALYLDKKRYHFLRSSRAAVVVVSRNDNLTKAVVKTKGAAILPFQFYEISRDSGVRVLRDRSPNDRIAGSAASRASIDDHCLESRTAPRRIRLNRVMARSSAPRNCPSVHADCRCGNPRARTVVLAFAASSGVIMTGCRGGRRQSCVTLCAK